MHLRSRSAFLDSIDPNGWHNIVAIDPEQRVLESSIDLLDLVTGTERRPSSINATARETFITVRMNRSLTLPTRNLGRQTTRMCERSIPTSTYQVIRVLRCKRSSTALPRHSPTRCDGAHVRRVHGGGGLQPIYSAEREGRRRDTQRACREPRAGGVSDARERRD